MLSSFKNFKKIVYILNFLDYNYNVKRNKLKGIKI